MDPFVVVERVKSRHLTGQSCGPESSTHAYLWLYNTLQHIHANEYVHLRSTYKKMIHSTSIYIYICIGILYIYLYTHIYTYIYISYLVVSHMYTSLLHKIFNALARRRPHLGVCADQEQGLEGPRPVALFYPRYEHFWICVLFIY